MQTVMKHDFSQIPRANINRSSFDRSHRHMTTIDAGLLAPIMVDEVVPGDTFNLRTSVFARIATPLVPIMDVMHATCFHFFCPSRILWDNLKKFHGAQDNPADSTAFLLPKMTAPAGGYLEGSIHDYFGLPTNIAGIENMSLLHRMYNKIINDWFRDQNLQDSVPDNMGDGPDDPADYVLKRRGKRHDYFTSCLPWPQKGDAVELPIGTSAPVLSDSTVIGFTANGTPVNIFHDATADLRSNTAAQSGFPYIFGANTGLYTDLSSATAPTINSVRLAFQLQKLLERDARGGTRYNEGLLSHYGVQAPDYRLQRPELLSVHRTPVNIHPVAQTSESGTTPQGNVSAFGTFSSSGDGYIKSFVEHGYVMTLICVDADLTYQQGIDRMFSRSERFDFYYPALARIGEQVVLSKEIYADGTANDNDVFGYIGRYDEYRHKKSLITGKFRSNYATSLDAYHLSEDFATRPVLNDSFIQSDPPLDRCIAVPSEPHFILDCYFSYICVRPMPADSSPGLIDHF